MIDVQKLKHEWKTFALAVATFLGGLYEAVAPSGYDLSVFVPEDYRKYVIPTIGISFLMLRQYRDHRKDDDARIPR